ncbi:VCBS repeat-containing protein [Arenibacter troitsensis]|uniref:Repeat domain-containing protein n=1 Tax=Arenibacter troitsensis TaxID=188872 RepID=A0A1X7L250_9FLAO|nr:VCBS repeat-containing protein [Arenibacter troitsensis]SMG47179.1 Repeat domain-containing protein [Arenibacter troitsensis]
MENRILKFQCTWFLFFILYMISTIGSAQDSNRFTLMKSSQTKIDFNNKIKDKKDSNILIYSNFYGGAGVGVGDFNNDGLQDLYFAGNMVPDKLYFNQGNFEFKDVTQNSGINDDGGWSTGVTIADVNNDGYLDIYVSRELYDDKPEWRTNLLYINNGDGKFVESASKYGVADSQRTRHATFLDYDKDGLLDLFLLTQPPNPGSYSEFSGTTLLREEYHIKLFKNTGKDFFIEKTKEAGLLLTGFPNGVSASDINNDGWTDIYVANDFNAPDFLLLNNKDGTFTNVADKVLNHMSYYSMGVDIADINNDALLDIFVVDMVAEDNFRLKSNMSGMNPDSFWKVVDEGGHYQYMYNALQLNNGNGTLSDVAQITGMAATDWSWSNLIADFDNDGLKDTYITNGLLHDIRNTDADKKVGSLINEATFKYLEENPQGGNITSIFDILDLDKILSVLPSQPLQNYAYKNMGDLNFRKVIEDWGLKEESFSNGSAYADLDNDGDLDLIVNNINEKAFVYKNNSEKFDSTNYLRIRLNDSSNRALFGTKITLYDNGNMQFLEHTNVRGIYSTSEPILHFGLNTAMVIDSILVQWPNDTYEVLKNVKTNQLLNLNMTNGIYKPNSSLKDNPSFFKESQKDLPFDYSHKENEFNDYDYQVLLPHKMSQFGPALAKGDVNNDGLEDIYIGGAFGVEASLYIADKNGGFSKMQDENWKKDADYEDVDALFVDINGDGFQDLYVVSGGNEYEGNDSHYLDRLYLNNGKGGFAKDTILNIYSISGSKVIAEDFDKDGDLDLFVGGRHEPHNYPRPATSMLLKNENGQLVNRTMEVAPELDSLGMVTDAVWSDYDNDGHKDLIVVGEWMPITIFKNSQGILNKIANPVLDGTSGWWFSLDKGDFDQDGDIDFVAGNIGLNYKYKTSPEKPFDIYYNDFDNNGNYDIVLGYYNGEKHYPLRGFSCSSEQIPGLKDKIKKYDLFASMELDQVYGKENLERSLHYKADTFASSYIENLGNGNFKVSALPNMAQLSNINDMLLEDFNDDGKLDVLVIGNLFVSEIETPRNDAGTGVLLLGDGKGGFDPLGVKESGFFANKDAKKIISVFNGDKKWVIVANNNDKTHFYEQIKNYSKP